MMSRSGFVLLVAVMACCVYGYGEVDQNGHPTWEERTNHLLVNAVRMDPTYYKNNLWNGFTPAPNANTLTSYYPAVNPVYLTNGLLRSSYNHSLDMASFTPANPGCFQHPTCGSNQDTFVRIKQFCPCGTLGENIAAGLSTPLQTNNQWLCDSNGTVCATDGSGSDGHRSNIMSKSYTAIGVGYAYVSGSRYGYYWTQDFSNCLTLGDGTYTNSIYGGSHYVLGSNTKFSAAWFNTSAPTSPVVVIGGTSSSLTLEMGSSTRGIYTYSTASVSVGTQYYFQLGSFRFPNTGFLVVVGTGYTSSWVPAGSSTTAAPTAAATTPAATSAPTTAALTTAAVTTAAATTAAPTTIAMTTAAPTTAAKTTAAATTAAPTTAAVTTVAATTAAKTTTAATTVAPTTVAATTVVAVTTAAPTTAVKTTAVPTTTVATTAAPTTTKAPTTSPTTVAPVTTASPTTVRASTASPATTAAPVTTSAPSGYSLFSNSLQNSWTVYENPGQTPSTSSSYLGKSVLAVTLDVNGASCQFFWLAHSTTVNSTAYTNLSFNIAASASQSINYYFNYEYTQTVAASNSAFTSVTTPFVYNPYTGKGMLAPGHTALGSSGHELVFSNPTSTQVTIYLYNIQFS